MLTRHGKNTLLRAAFYGEKSRRRRIFITSKGWKNVVFRAKNGLLWHIKTHDLCSFRFVIPTTSIRLPHHFLFSTIICNLLKNNTLQGFAPLQT
ncbi:MAG: hypothetical protein IJ928_11050 [Prevotella sp.]|nr:hypothetical protein [Prevotella sp.]